MTAVEVAQMTKAEAEKLTLRINRDGFKLGDLLVQAHDGRAWAVLGYSSWSAYIAGEFTFSRATSYRLLAAEREPDALVQGSECLTDETDGAENSPNDSLVAVADVDQRPLDTITPVVLPAKKSEGVPARETMQASPAGVPSGPSAPREAASAAPEREVPPRPVPAAPAPPEPALDRIPSDRELTARVLTAMHDVDPDDAGPVLTAEDATMVKGWADRSVRAWQRSLGIATDGSGQRAHVEARSPGHVIRPKERRAKAEAATPVDPAICRHPKDRERRLSYAVLCGVCEARIR